MNKKNYRLPMCIFLFIVGSGATVLLSNAINDIMLFGKLVTPVSSMLPNLFQYDKMRQIAMLLEAFVLMVCVLYYFLAQRSYQADTFDVTDDIKIPIHYGQGQHGTAWFMSDAQKQKAFDYITISPVNPAIHKLLKLGEQRYNAIENGEVQEIQKPIRNLSHCKGGLVIGREPIVDGEKLPCITKDVHSLIIGATRCGKTRCLVIQSVCTLAFAGEGLVVNDPKGEIYHYTHEYLSSLGYTVQVVDFQSPKKSNHYNPMQMIIDAINEGNNDDAQTYAWDLTTFMVEKNDHSEPIWTNGEMAVIAAAILCVAFDNQDHPQYQNLTNVYHFIANMCKTENKVMPLDAYMQKLPDSHPAKALMAIAKIAPDRMGGSFFTSALTTLRLFTTNDVYRVTGESEFSLKDVGMKERQALFFILPDQKTTFYPIVTLYVSQQYEQLVTYAKTVGNRLPHRVNFVLDEFGNFTAITDFSAKMTVAGGYGIRWNLFVQDFNQLIEKYGQDVAGIIKGNCHYWIYLHSADTNTNEEISKRLGKYTTTSYSLGSNLQKYSAPSSSTNIQLSERNLLMPEEVEKIRRPYQLVISDYPPVMQNAPDLSQWLYNKILGLGDEEHNKRLIAFDEQQRPTNGEDTIIQSIWKPWEIISSKADNYAMDTMNYDDHINKAKPQLFFERRMKI